jgi:undecaprenyl-phosphate 4-deoxy-4-formamido-L-arabinose transferase
MKDPIQFCILKEIIKIKEMDISIVIPVYNGELTISALLEKIVLFFNEKEYVYEVIFVHDCGKDGSLGVLKKLEKQFDFVKVIKLNRNYGQHNAIISGFNYCSGELIVTMDEDLQHDPDDIKHLINKQKEGDFDVVYGFYDILKHSGFRNISSRCLKKVLAMSIPELHKDYSAYRLIKSNVAKETIKMQNSYTFLDGYFTWITNHVSSTKVSHNERFAGESSYGIKKLIEHSLNIVFTFSNMPIRLLSYSSLLVFLFTFVYSIYVVIRKFLYDDFLTGYPTLIISIGIGI